MTTDLGDWDDELAAAVAHAALYCRSQSSNGNIQVMHTVSAVRALAQALVGAETFAAWEHWVAPGYVVVRRALDGGEPG